MDDDDPWGLPHICPACDACYSTQAAADECRDIDREQDRLARAATRRAAARRA